METSKSLDELQSLASVSGKIITDSEVLDCKIASGFRKVSQGNFIVSVSTEATKAQKEDSSLGDR